MTLTPSTMPDALSVAAMSAHVLVVDDDPAIRQLLTDYLGDNEWRVTAVATGAQMREVLAQEAIDLVILDLKLPGEDGMMLARELRERANLPIVLLTGRLDEADRVMGLELGADDYVTKPFSNRELLARLRAVRRRYQLQSQAQAEPLEDRRRAFRFAGWELNLRTRRLSSPEGERIELSNNEFSLLVAFCASPQRVLTRDQLLTLSRLHSAEVYDRTVDVQVLRLRRKIEPDPLHPQLIKTERGAGYLFDATVETLV
jgi:DNA-binding response OmpR family regulator